MKSGNETRHRKVASDSKTHMENRAFKKENMFINKMILNKFWNRH